MQRGKNKKKKKSWFEFSVQISLLELVTSLFVKQNLTFIYLGRELALLLGRNMLKQKNNPLFPKNTMLIESKWQY